MCAYDYIINQLEGEFNAIKTITLIQGSGYITEQSFLDKRIRVFGTRKIRCSWHEMLQTVDDDEKGVRNVYTPGGMQEAWFLTEDGLYEVLMQSRKPKAKEFKKEVKKILKSIRKTGGYVVGQENMMQHRTYERHRSCTFFFLCPTVPGALPTLQNDYII